MSRRRGSGSGASDVADDGRESRARVELGAHPECPPSVMGRLLYVADLMSSGLWRKGETGPEIASAWGLSVSTVEDYSAEASRWLKKLVDPDPVKERLAFRLAEALNDARGDARSVAEVAKAYMPLVGISTGPTTVNLYVDQRGQVLPGPRALLLAACEVAGAMGLEPRAYLDALAARLAPTMPVEAVAALPAPAGLSAGDRVRAMLPAMLEAWPDVDGVEDLVPALRIMAGDDGGET